MSWDVAIFNLRGSPRSLDEFRDDMLLALGPPEKVRQAISAVLPDVDWSDPTWGLYGRDGFSIEFSVGDKDPTECVMLHVRGQGDAIADIVKLVEATGWAALDCSTSEFLDPAAPSDAGWVGWQGYRDKIVKHSRAEAASEG